MTDIKRLSKLLHNAKVEYSKYLCSIDDKLTTAKTNEEIDKILEQPIVGIDDFSALFLQKNGLKFEVFAEYENVSENIFRCSNCHCAPVATHDNNWAFTRRCHRCGAKMKNAEEMQKNKREKNGYKEV